MTSEGSVRQGYMSPTTAAATLSSSWLVRTRSASQKLSTQLLEGCHVSQSPESLPKERTINSLPKAFTSKIHSGCKSVSAGVSVQGRQARSFLRLTKSSSWSVSLSSQNHPAPPHYPFTHLQTQACTHNVKTFRQTSSTCLSASKLLHSGGNAGFWQLDAKPLRGISSFYLHL